MAKSLKRVIAYGLGISGHGVCLWFLTDIYTYGSHLAYENNRVLLVGEIIMAISAILFSGYMVIKEAKEAKNANEKS